VETGGYGPVPNIAPAPMFPERAPQMYDRKFSPAQAGERGPARFQEGVGTDTDVPNEFAKGAMQGYVSAPGRPNRNMNVYEKWPEETLRERAHVGSAAWIEAPTFLGEFAHGGFTDRGELRYEMDVRSGGRYNRLNPTVVDD
jgi:hypothetical protein